MPSSTLVEPYFSQTFCPEPCADPDGAACAAGDTADALDGAALPVGGDASPDDAEVVLDPAGALEDVSPAGAEPVAGSEVAAAEVGAVPEVLGADVLVEPAVVAGTPVPDGDPAEFCAAVGAEGTGSVEEADRPESERDVVTEP